MIFWWISEKRNEADETVVKIWHLYAVEMCLRAKECTKFGGWAAEYNPGIRHFSGGNVDINYMKKFKQLLVIYKHQGYIWTTCKKNAVQYGILLSLFWSLENQKIAYGKLSSCTNGKINFK